MAIIKAEESDNHDCPFNDFSPCRGPRCMAWIWTDRPFDEMETDNLTQTESGVVPVGTPPPPAGDGWEPDGPSHPKGYHRSAKDNLPPGLAQRWRRKRETVMGCCGRIPAYNSF